MRTLEANTNHFAFRSSSAAVAPRIISLFEFNYEFNQQISCRRSDCNKNQGRDSDDTCDWLMNLHSAVLPFVHAHLCRCHHQIQIVNFAKFRETRNKHFGTISETLRHGLGWDRLAIALNSLSSAPFLLTDAERRDVPRFLTIETGHCKFADGN